ncbi:MAG TPA: DNA-binding protein WhiA [Tissierellaceae bacterium]|nr:DNA-binding protein WhiA [Tissierellaceae bacterium]
MSFSSTTKNELARIPITDNCCKLAELAALVRMCGTIQISGNNNINIKFTTENAAIARRLFTFLKELYEGDIEVMVRRNRQLKKNNNYHIAIKDKDISRKLLIDVGFLSEDEDINIFNILYKINNDLLIKRCCRRSYIRGAFLGAGSISNPEKTYHIEFVTNNKEQSEELSNIINSFRLNSKIVLRKDNYVVYLKEGEQIVDLLNIMGAHQALLKFEDIRVLKDVRNNINRLVNCETANLTKTIDASLRQLEDIEKIQSSMGLEKLPKKLRDVAEIRLENPDATLKEIGLMLEPPVGKSGVNHRFRKIGEIAEDLKGV